MILPGSIVRTGTSHLALIFASVLEHQDGLPRTGFSFLIRDGRVFDFRTCLLSPNRVSYLYREVFSVQKESG